MNRRKLSPRSAGTGSNSIFKRSSSVSHVNVVLLGALGVGKSAMTVKFMTRRFIMDYDPSLEDTYSKRDIVDGQEVQFNVMDTYDKNGPKPEVDKFIGWCDVAFVVYSIENQQSYNRAREYLQSVRQSKTAITGSDKSTVTAAKDIPIAIIANKADLVHMREVTSQTGVALAEEFDCMYYEVSAAEDYDIIRATFHDAARMAQHGKDHLLTPTTPDGVVSRWRRPQPAPMINTKRAKSPKPNSGNNIMGNSGGGNRGGISADNGGNGDKSNSLRRGGHQRKPSPTFKLFNKIFN